MVKLLLTLFFFITLITCSQINLGSGQFVIKNADIGSTKVLIIDLLQALAKEKDEKSMLLSFLEYAKKDSKASRNTQKKIFLQALSEIVVDICDNTVEEAKDGVFTEMDRESMNIVILAAANELKHLKSISMEVDFLEPMMISILEALKHFQPVSDITRKVIPKISFYCVTEASLSILFDLILENMKKAGTKLPLMKINPKIKSTESYEAFILHFLLWTGNLEQVPTQFLLWNIIHGPDTPITTEALITLATPEVLIPFLVKKPDEVLPVFMKFAKAQRQEKLFEILRSNSGAADILNKVEDLQKAYEIFDTVTRIDLEHSSNEMLENYVQIFQNRAESFGTFYKFENLFTEEQILNLNEKLFKVIEDFPKIECLTRKRLLKRVVLFSIKCYPIERFDNLSDINYDPLLDFVLVPDEDMANNINEYIYLKRLICLPYLKLTESFMHKLWRFYLHFSTVHESVIWCSALTSIMFRESPDNPNIDIIKMIHEFYESVGLDYNELISLVLYFAISHEEIGYARQIVDYCKERRLLQKTHFKAIETVENYTKLIRFKEQL